jgi:hypothetical protein
MINERGCWMSASETNTHEFDKSLCDAILRLFKKVDRVVDIGCGKGDYVKEFIFFGIPCTGYDGSPLTPKLSGNTCFIKDFSDPVDIGKAELVISLEVGEHIPEQYEQIFIDNLARASSRYIVLSWAVEGQCGIGHVNCRNNDYIIKAMQRRGFDCDYGLTEYLREKSSLPWFKNSLMVLVR